MSSYKKLKIQKVNIRTGRVEYLDTARALIDQFKCKKRTGARLVSFVGRFEGTQTIGIARFETSFNKYTVLLDDLLSGVCFLIKHDFATIKEIVDGTVKPLKRAVFDRLERYTIATIKRNASSERDEDY